MSFLEKMRSWWTSEPSSADTATNRLYIVDATGLARVDGKTDRVSPGMQVKVLQRLSRFTQKEGIALSVVLQGKELRAVSDGEDFQGIKVHFAPKAQGLNDLVMKLMRAAMKSAQPIVITDRKDLESQVVEAGGTPMRLATFRKALESIGGENGNRSQNRRRNPRRKGSDHRDRGGRSRSREPSANKDPVHDLIDVVE